MTTRPRAGPLQPSIATTTSPTLPVASRRSPTASATSPWEIAMRSRASNTDSSNVRPFAVPFSRSAPTSSSLSFSSRRACSSFWSSPSLPSSARCVASERPAASLIDRTAADLKSASGLRSSEEENWRTRSSRDLVRVSATASRTRFCTDTALPSPKRRSSSLASWPSSSPKTSANWVSKNSAIVRALSANSTCTSLDAFSNSVLTNSALAAACSRSSTRAPISTASRTVLTGSSPLLSRSWTRRTAQRSSTTRPSMTTRSPSVRTWGGRRGVAASIVVGDSWSHGTAPT